MPILALFALGACSSPGGPYPSLQPRAAEAIDPRVAVVRPLNDRPVTPALAAQLASLVAQARSGQAAFAPVAANAEQLAQSAGAAQSEGWIAAQEMLSAAIAARRPTALALSDIDAMAATKLDAQGGIAPSDLAAIEAASSEVQALARGQTDRIDAIQKRLGR